MITTNWKNEKKIQIGVDERKFNINSGDGTVRVSNKMEVNNLNIKAIPPVVILKKGKVIIKF